MERASSGSGQGLPPGRAPRQSRDSQTNRFYWSINKTAISPQPELPAIPLYAYDEKVRFGNRFTLWQLIARTGCLWAVPKLPAGGGTDVADCIVQVQSVEPWAYLKDVFTGLPILSTPEDLQKLLPDLWLFDNPNDRWKIAETRKNARK